MGRRNKNYGGYLVAFGIGALVVMALPSRFILVVTALVLVLAGLSLLRCR